MEGVNVVSVRRDRRDRRVSSLVADAEKPRMVDGSRLNSGIGLDLGLVEQSYFSLPCGHGLQSAQKLFSLPCGHGLQSAHLLFSLPCGHGLQSAQKRFT